MMNITAATAHADQLAAHIRDARCCDALDVCQPCKSTASEIRTIRHAARVATLRPAVYIPVPRTALAARLAAARI